jgi:hypothetical protein
MKISMRGARGAHYVRLNDTTWPVPPDDDLEWALRYGTPTRFQLLRAASVLSAYHALIANTDRRRREIVRELKRAIAVRG